MSVYDDEIEYKEQEKYLKQWIEKKKLKEERKQIKKQKRKEWFLNLFKF